MTTEELSLIVAGLAVVVGPGVAYLLGSRRFDHERDLADRDDARKVLAGAARELWRMKQAMRDHFGPMSDGLRTGQPVPEYAERIRILEDRRDAVEGELDVIRIRFAKDRPLVIAYTEAWEAVKRLLSIYMSDMRGGGQGSKVVGEAGAINVEFDSRREAFLAEAAAAVGAKLPDQD